MARANTNYIYDKWEIEESMNRFKDANPTIVEAEIQRVAGPYYPTYEHLKNLVQTKIGDRKITTVQSYMILMKVRESFHKKNSQKLRSQLEQVAPGTFRMEPSFTERDAANVLVELSKKGT